MDKAKIRHDRKTTGCNYKKGDKVWRLIGSTKRGFVVLSTTWIVLIPSLINCYDYKISSFSLFMYVLGFR